MKKLILLTTVALLLSSCSSPAAVKRAAVKRYGPGSKNNLAQLTVQKKTESLNKISYTGSQTGVIRLCDDALFSFDLIESIFYSYDSTDSEKRIMRSTLRSSREEVAKRCNSKLGR